MIFLSVKVLFEIAKTEPFSGLLVKVQVDISINFKNLYLHQEKLDMFITVSNKVHCYLKESATVEK